MAKNLFRQTAVWGTFAIGLMLIVFLTPNAMADSVELSLNMETAHAIGPQSTQSPCIIAGTHCSNPAGFSYTNYTQGGSIDAYDELSPTYLKADFPFLEFNIAIDVNTAQGGEILDEFEIWQGEVGSGVLLYFYHADGDIGNTQSNGNGWADWTLRSIDLTQIPTDVGITFRASWNTASGGSESFFLYSTESTQGLHAPEPTTLILLGTGLAILLCGTIRRKRE